MSHPIRKQAEKILGTEPPMGIADLMESNQTLKVLVHELRVHQIELELQNEELQQTQRELEKTKQKYAELYDFAPVGYFTFDTKGIILQVNLTGAQQLGIERLYLTHKPFILYIHPDCHERFYRHITKVIELQQNFNCELTLKTSQGDYFEAYLESTPNIMENSKVVYCHTALMDVSDKKQVEHDLEKSRRYLEQRTIELVAANHQLQEEIQNRQLAEKNNTLFLQIINQLKTPVFIKDDLHRWLFLNDVACELLGQPREELLGKSDYDFFPMDEARLFCQTDDQVFQTGQTIVSEESMWWQEQLHTVTTLKSLYVDPETHQKYIVGVIQDVTHIKQVEESLRRSEERFELAMRGANDGVWDWNLETHTVYYSPRFSQMLGLADLNQITGESSFMAALEGLIHPNDRYGLQEAVKAYLNRQTTVFEYTFRLRHQEGHWIWVLSRGTALWNAEGQPVRLVGTQMDLTAQKQAETALAKFGQLTEQLLKMPLIIYRISPSGHVTEARGAGLQLLKLIEKPVVGNNVFELFADAKTHLEQALLGRTQQFLYTWRYHDKWLAYENLLTADKVAGGAIGIALDVSKRVAAEQALRESEEYWRLLIKEANIGLGLFDNQGFMVDANPAFANLLGYEVAEFLAERFHYCDLTSSGYDEAESIPQLLEQGRFGPYEKEYRHKAGHYIPVRLSGLTIQRKGEVFAWISIADITYQKQVEDSLRRAKEAAEVANLAKSAFLANMSHELRTPLNAILGYAQIFKLDQTLTSHQLEDIETIQRSGEYLLTLINEVLDLSKIEAERLELLPSHFYLEKFLQDIVGLFKLRASQKGLTFHYQQLTQLPSVVYADETRLRQILLNLLSNAVKFTERGAVYFKVGYHYNNLRFQVEDNGIGIATEDLSKLFLPFQQVGQRNYRTQGTGLGLAISQKLAQMMGGKLQVLSSLGQGSTFWLEVHLPEVSIHLPADHHDNMNQPMIIGIVGASHKILVIDDNRDNRLVLRRLLEPIGFEIIEANNGQEGITQAQSYHPNLILMDLVMPIMDGWEATRQLKAIPTLTNIPVIIVSASAFDYHLQQSKAAGCDDFIAKPIDAKLLLEKLQKFLQVQWRYADSVAASLYNMESQKLSEEHDLSHLVLTQEQAETLLNLALMGDVTGLSEYATQLKAEFPQLTPLAHKISQWSREIEYEPILAIAQKYMNGQETKPL